MSDPKPIPDLAVQRLTNTLRTTADRFHADVAGIVRGFREQYADHGDDLVEAAVVHSTRRLAMETLFEAWS